MCIAGCQGEGGMRSDPGQSRIAVTRDVLDNVIACGDKCFALANGLVKPLVKGKLPMPNPAWSIPLSQGALPGDSSACCWRLDSLACVLQRLMHWVVA